MTDVKRTPEHIEAVNRRRRIIFQDDVLANSVFRSKEVGRERMEQAIDFYMSRLDAADNQIDSVWHEWGEGNTAKWPSKVLPRTEEVFPQWWAVGMDPIEVLLEETRKRGREVFFSYRINGSDNDRLFDPPHPLDAPIPLKEEHPDWLFHKWHVYWDFSFDGVRDLKLRVLREVAEMYDYDGISIDFARVPVLFPEGQQWEQRDVLTGFMRQVRSALLEIGSLRGRPYLLAARVPEDLPGCHFDGMDIEAWIREELVDILVVGARTANADVAAFRHVTAATPVKVYPSWDDHHSSDGYRHPSLEIWRGVCANWWRHNPDGMHTFNLTMGSPEAERNLEITPAPRHRGGEIDGVAVQSAWESQCSVYREIGSTETLREGNKIFFVERRGGGHDQEVVPDPNQWYTPRHMYFQTNMQAPLPAHLVGDGSADTLLRLEVADDVNERPDNIDRIELRLALSFAATGASTEKGNGTVQEIDVEVRINNLLLGDPYPERGTVTALNVTFDHWLVFSMPSRHLAVGTNLVGVRLSGKHPEPCSPVRIEKLELHVCYK